MDVEVRDGDTLWNIASRYTSTKEDVREKVHIIKTINGLDQNAKIYEGQTLKVPVTKDLPY
ncbi:MAG: yneA [Firmicutes bacterium]|nr:yneA [Bacillota bacterium]